MFASVSSLSSQPPTQFPGGFDTSLLPLVLRAVKAPPFLFEDRQYD